MNKHSLFLCAAVLPGVLFGATARAQDTAPATGTTTAATADANQPVSFPQGILFPYYLLDRALQKNVDNEGNVNYVGIRSDKEASQMLDLFVQAVASADMSKFPVLPKKVTTKDKLGQETEQTQEDRSAELVFWLNAYNGLVLKTLVDAYPINSPDDIKDFDTSKRRVGGQALSLAEMRKKIASLDPRGLFAITDGTKGGPYLRQTAYRLTDVDPALDTAVQLYVSNPNQVQAQMLEKKITVSPFLQQVDEYFTPKSARRKWEGVRYILALYTTHGATRRFFINNPDLGLTFTRPNRALNRDSNQNPTATQ